MYHFLSASVFKLHILGFRISPAQKKLHLDTCEDINFIPVRAASICKEQRYQYLHFSYHSLRRRRTKIIWAQEKNGVREGDTRVSLARSILSQVPILLSCACYPGYSYHGCTPMSLHSPLPHCPKHTLLTLKNFA